MDLVFAVGAIEGGDWWTSADVADLVGLDSGRCRQLLAELAAERVILRDGGAGGRVFWCEVNPRWWTWDVEWRHEPRHVRQRLADVRERRSTAALIRFTARPIGARYPEISARLSARDEAMRGALDSQLPRAYAARGNPVSGEAYRAPIGARDEGGADRAPMGRAVNPQEPPPYTSIPGSSYELPPLEPQEGREQSSPVVAVIEAISARTRCRIYGTLRDETIPALVARWGAPAVLAMVEQVEPAGMKAPAYVIELEHRLVAAVEAAAGAELGRKRAELRDLKRDLGALQVATSGALPDDLVERHDRLCDELGESPELPLPLVLIDVPTADVAPPPGLAERVARTQAAASTMSTPNPVADAPGDIRGA